MPGVVNVTVGSKSLVRDAAIAVRREFPGASLNEILRYCGLVVTEGKRIAREMVFGNAEDIELTRDHISAEVPAEEREILNNYVRGGRTLSEIYREGLYLEAGESPAKARELARMPRGPKRATHAT